MTKNRKIELLVNDNKRLMDENRRLHEISSEEISKKMISEMERYTDVIDKLYVKYGGLDRLRLIGIKNKLKYQRMLLGLRLRKVFGV